jgi:hypothetical protein
MQQEDREPNNDKSRVSGSASVAAEQTEQESTTMSWPASGWGNDLVGRALKSQNFWLSLTWLGLILLMARTYA